MPDPSKLLLLDIFHLTLLMLGFGLLAFALIRRSNPLVRWHEHGNVWTDPFFKVDLVILVIIVGSYYMLIHYAAYSEKPAGTDVDPLGIAAMELPTVEVDGHGDRFGSVESGGVEVGSGAVRNEVDLFAELPMRPVLEPEVEPGQRRMVGVGSCRDPGRTVGRPPE